jgi:hypothetical protein
LSFLGYRIFPYQLKLTHASRKRLGRKLSRIDTEYHQGIISEKQAQRRAQSLIAFVDHANTTALRKDLLKKSRPCSRGASIARREPRAARWLLEQQRQELSLRLPQQE